MCGRGSPALCPSIAEGSWVRSHWGGPPAVVGPCKGMWRGIAWGGRCHDGACEDCRRGGGCIGCRPKCSTPGGPAPPNAQELMGNAKAPDREKAREHAPPPPPSKRPRGRSSTFEQRDSGPPLIDNKRLVGSGPGTSNANHSKTPNQPIHSEVPCAIRTWPQGCTGKGGGLPPPPSRAPSLCPATCQPQRHL